MLSAAAIAPLMGAVLGAVQGAVLCESEDFPVETFAAMMVPLAPVFIDQMQHTLSTIADNRFDQSEAALKTYASSISDRTEESRARGVNVEFYGFVDEILNRAIGNGFGDEELSAVISSGDDARSYVGKQQFQSHREGSGRSRRHRAERELLAFCKWGSGRSA